MLPIVNKPPLTRGQKNAALALAMLVDFIQVPGAAMFGLGVISPFEDVLDIFTAILLTAICGFKWQFALAFATELVPMLDLFPTWTAVVAMLPVESSGRVEARPAGGSAGAQRVNVSVNTPAGSGGGRRETHVDVIDVDAVAVPPVQPPPVRG